MKALTERQGEILGFIRDYIQENQYPPSIREIGRNFGMSVKGAFDHVRALERKEAIVIGHRRSRTITLVPDVDGQGKNRRIPLLENIAPGLPLFAKENQRGSLFLPLQLLARGELFALRVQGDSMTGAGIFDGDLGIFVHQSLANDDEIVVAMVNDTVKLRRFFKDANLIQLQAENPLFPAIFTQNVKILGKLITLVRQYG